jgi:predicted AlkP superfamily phosphohydrolase/phosphomutase
LGTIKDVLTNSFSTYNNESSNAGIVLLRLWTKTRSRERSCYVKEDQILTYIKEMGGVKMIVASDDSLDTGFTLVLPAAIVNSERGAKIDKYINTTNYVYI